VNNWYDILPMTQVGHRLFVGGYAKAAELAKSNPHKITAVLCVHQEMEYPKNPDIVYMHVPFPDGKEIPPKAFVKCLGWLKHMYENGHTIYIHCAAGISRSVTITASFMHYEGIAEFNDALDQIRLSRPNASPAPNVLRSAKQMLKVYPYDGTYESEPEHQKSVHGDLIEQVQNQRAALQHPDENCPMRKFLLSGEESNVPRHEIPCSCSELLSALDRAKLEVAKQREGIAPSEPVDFSKLQRKVDGDA
jgi:protein-tyrosine phosphatase